MCGTSGYVCLFLFHFVSGFVTVKNNTVTVTKVFILRFLLKDRKRITESFTYIQ